MDVSGYTGRIYGYIVDKRTLSGEFDGFTKRIRSWAHLTNNIIHELICDTIERSKMKFLMENLKSKDTLVICSYTNAFKNSRDFLHLFHEFFTRGVRFVSINEGLDTSSPYGKFTGTMMASIASMQDDDGEAELTPEQFEAMKNILSSEQLEILEPYIYVMIPFSSDEDEEADEKQSSTVKQICN
jgi:DNA invertase Pin-like site-specific DNA recombinase